VYLLSVVDVATRVYVLLTPGIFVYMGGCLLLLIAQVVHLLKERGRSETPSWIVAWLAKNRITIACSTLLVVFTLFILRYAGSGVILFSDAYPRFVYVNDPSTIVLMFFDLFPVVLLLVPIGVDIMLIVISRNRFGRGSSLSFPFGSMGGNMFRWMVWVLPLFVLALIVVLNALDPPVLLTRVVLPFGISTDSTAYLLSGGALGLPILLGLFIIFPVPLLWIADLIASQPQHIRG
jgi:hypothetical protein